MSKKDDLIPKTSEDKIIKNWDSEGEVTKIDLSNPDVEITIPKQQHLPKELLERFLLDNNLELTVSPISENIKYVSDGSVILAKPVIRIAYKNG